MVTDPRNNQTTYFHDGQGRVLRVVDAKGHERAQPWTPDANVLTSTPARAGLTEAEYNTRHRITTLQRPGWAP